MTINCLLIAFLLLIICFDIKYKKIYNLIAYPFIGIGIAFNCWSFGFMGVVTSLIGFWAGFCICLFPYKYKICNVGEFKLLGLIGVLKGWHFVLIIGLISYIATLIFQHASLIAKSSWKTFMVKSKIYFELITQYGIDISTIADANMKKVIIPYSLTVSFVSIILLLVIV